MRGAFQSHDPILCAAQDGAELPIRAECKDWFLFCFSQSNEVYCDTEPWSTHCASRRVGAVLRGMGGPHGTFGSFRKGLATNAVAMNIIENRGKKYDTGVTDLLARIGGWDILLGYKTLNQHYISKAVDSCVDLFGFAMGRDVDEAEWQQILRDFKGVDRWPAGPVVDKGRREVPLVVRFNAWHSQLYRTVHDRLCRAIRLLLRVANADEAIMPVRRYMSSREALAAVIRRHAGCAVVRAVMRLRVEARAAWKVALEHEVAQVVVGYVQHCQAAGAGHGLPRSTARVQAHALAAVHDLVIGAYERLGCGCSLCCCRRGCRAYHFCTVTAEHGACRACAGASQRVCD